MELRHLRAFSAVGKELHFGRAAAVLNIAQPALTKTIQQLEAEVGTPLLIRNTRHVTLTDAGRTFLAEVGSLYAQLEQAVASARHVARGIKGELRIAYTDFAINGRLPHLLRQFASDHPEIRLNLFFMPTTTQHMALLQRDIDIGFMIDCFPHEGMNELTIDHSDYVALLPSNHPLCAKDAINLADLAQEKFVLGTPDNWAAFRNTLFIECRKLGFFPDIALEASNSQGIFGLVVAGAGVTVFSSSIGAIVREGIEVRPLKDVKAKLPVTAVWAPDNRQEILSIFTSFLRRQV